MACYITPCNIRLSYKKAGLIFHAIISNYEFVIY